MPPKVDRAEAVFDAVQAILDDNDISHWRAQETELLLSLIGAYYANLKTQQTIAKRGARQRGDGADKKAVEKHSEGEDEDEEEDDDAEALQHEAAVAAVDRALAKVRSHLQKRVPYGSLQEPSAVAYEAAPEGEEEEERNSRRDGGKGHKRAKTTDGESAAAALAGKRGVVYSLDSFLYLEEDIDELCEAGVISRHYCTECGSTKLAPTDFITHSFSQDQLIFLSCFLLPALGEEGPEVSTRTVVDVGSRLGVALWACCFAAQQQVLTRTEKVIGVELDSRLVGIQRESGKRFCPRPIPLPPLPATGEGGDGENVAVTPQGKAQERHLTWSVVESDCFLGEGAAALAGADVLILHNVFEYFCATEEQHVRCWLKLRSLVKRRGQILICAPSIEETFMAFSEEALVACGILTQEAKEAADTHRKSAKRPRSAELNRKESGKVLRDAGEDESKDGQGLTQPQRKELAIAQWIADYLEPVEDEVEQLAEEFIEFRTAMQHHSSESDEEEREEQQGHGHGDAEDGSCHDHDNGHCCSSGSDEAGGGGGGEPSELEEQIRNIWVYRVK